MSKLKFKGKAVYTKTCVDNILRAYNKSRASRDWYRDTFQFGLFFYLIKKVDALEKVFGVIAALSPQKLWEENKKLAVAFFEGSRKGHTRTNIDKAKHILALERPRKEDILDILNGEKTKAFFLNMLEPEEVNGVTIDRHAVEIALGKVIDNHQMTVNQYKFFERCYFIASNEVGLLPHELQSVTWEYWREYKKTL